ncbi:hypothetical protein [Nocardioides sp.]|jgi:hypothetical protein|nr:hypothetical protein [Nocardioides sp.]
MTETPDEQQTSPDRELTEDELADEMSEESFPSSDPPSTWVGESTPADD